MKIKQKVNPLYMKTNMRDYHVKGPLGSGFYIDDFGYNSYVSNYVSNLSTRGFTAPDSVRLAAMNDWIDSIGSTIMAKIDLFRIIALNNDLLSDASRVNMINPAANLADYVLSPMYQENGIMGNASDAYVDNNFNPTTHGVNYVLDSASRLIFVEATPTVNNILDGVASTANNRMLSSSGSAAIARINSTNNLSANGNITGTGLKGICRSSSTVVELHNETTMTSFTQTSVAMPNEDQLLLRSSTSYSNAVIGGYIMASYLSQAEVLTIRSGYLAYKTAIGL